MDGDERIYDGIPCGALVLNEGCNPAGPLGLGRHKPIERKLIDGNIVDGLLYLALQQDQLGERVSWNQTVWRRSGFLGPRVDKGRVELSIFQQRFFAAQRRILSTIAEVSAVSQDVEKRVGFDLRLTRPGKARERTLNPHGLQASTLRRYELDEFPVHVPAKSSTR